MQRRTSLTSVAVAAALTTTLIAGLASCADGSDGADGADSTTGAPPSASTAPPGKYETLPEPCGTVDVSTLSDLLPAAESPSPTEAGDTPRPLQGEATVTYDTDRRAGCRWKNTTSVGSRHLHIDFERVVSYDSAVSDEERAVERYREKTREAGLPDAASPAPTSEKPSPKPSGKPSEKASEKTSAPSTETSPSSPGSSASDDGDSTPSVAPTDPKNTRVPRSLPNIGDTAFLDDVLDTTDSGVHRDVVLVFRTANVVVTVTYAQWMTDHHQTPNSAELQTKAERLGLQLASRFAD